MTTARQALEYKLNDLERGIKVTAHNLAQTQQNLEDLRARLERMQAERDDISRALETGDLDHG